MPQKAIRSWSRRSLRTRRANRLAAACSTQHPALLDTLEPRVLLAAVQGHVWLDADENGLQNNNEAGRTGVTVRLLDAANALVASATTDNNGAYSFSNLDNGQYSIEVVLPSGYLFSTKDVGADDALDSDADPLTGRTAQIALSDEQPTGDLDAGLVINYGTITGRVYDDLNANGQYNDGEPARVDQTVYVDLDNDGVLDESDPRTQTDANGQYTFARLVPGNYRVRLILPAGAYLTSPSTGSQFYMLAPGQTVTTSNFAVVRPGTISGVVFKDMNANGVKDPGENGLANWVVRLVGDASNPLNPSEQNFTTDSTGAYSFSNVLPGAYVLRLTAQSGWSQTTTDPLNVTLSSNGNLENQLIGVAQPANSIRGFAYADVNGNGIRDDGENALGGNTFYIDANNNGQKDVGERTTTANPQGEYVFADLVPGTYRVRHQPFNNNPWRVTAPAEGYYDVTTEIGQSVSGKNFLVYYPADISGTVYNDKDANGNLNDTAAGLPGITVFIDANANGILDQGETSVVTDASGNYIFNDMEYGTYLIQVVLPQVEGVFFKSPSEGKSSVTATGNVVHDRDFGLVFPTTISGTLYVDADGDSVRDEGETPLGGWVVFLDTNNNGKIDPGETQTLTDAEGKYTFTNLLPRLPDATGSEPDADETYNVRIKPHAGWRRTASGLNASDPNVQRLPLFSKEPVTQNFGLIHAASVSGYVYYDRNGDDQLTRADRPVAANWRVFVDLNGNGVWDATEPQGLTNDKGYYTITNIAAPASGETEYLVQPYMYRGWRMVNPESAREINLSAGGQAQDANFLLSDKATISGYIFRDRNQNGAYNYGERAIANWRVFIDVNNDGVWNKNTEPSLLTNAQGYFEFRSVSPGFVALRAYRYKGYKPTTGANYRPLKVTANAILTAQDFGQVPTR